MAAAALVLVLVLPVLSPAVRSTISELFLSGQAASGGPGGGGGGAASAEQESVAASGSKVASGMAGVAGGEETLGKPGSGGQMAGAASASGEAMESEDMAAAGDGGAGGGGGRRNDRPVPDVVGMRAAAACRKLFSSDYAGYVVRTVDEAGIGPGRVVSQRPEAGPAGTEGGVVELTVAEPLSPEDLRRGGPACVDVTQ